MQLGRQEGGTCSYVSSLTQQSFSGNGGSGELLVATGSNCTWAPETLDSWLTLASTAPRVGPGRVAFTVASTTGGAREGRLRVAGQILTVSQGATCAFTVSPTSLVMNSGGGSAAVSVTTSPLCDWTAQSNASWLSVAPASGSGSGAVTVTAQANAGTDRQGTVTIAGVTVSVSQGFTCQLSLNPTTVTHGPEAQSQSVAVATGPGCAWTAQAAAPWFTLLNKAGVGAGGVGYSLQTNTGPQRSVTLSVAIPGASATAAITQLSGCTYSMSQVDLNSWSSSPPFTITVTASATDCPWTLRMSNPFLTVGGQTNVTGGGTATLTLTVDCSASPGSVTITLVDEKGVIRAEQQVIDNYCG
jgi:hypothetical protein